MNCQDFDLIVIDLARAKPLEAARRALAVEHAETCNRCSVRLSDEQMLAGGLKALAADAESQCAPPAIEEALLAQFRQTLTVPAKNSVVPLPGLPARRSQTRYWLAAAAAALLIATFSFATSQLFKGTLPKQPTITLVPGAPSSPAGEISSGEPKAEHDHIAVEIADPGNKSSSKHRKRRPSRQGINDHSSVIASVGEFTPVLTNQETRSEVATDFFPLTHEPASQPLESGQLIRVQMPRSALASFGLPINVEQADVPVKADVLLADDGSARAIRFIR